MGTSLDTPPRCSMPRFPNYKPMFMSPLLPSPLQMRGMPVYGLCQPDYISRLVTRMKPSPAMLDNTSRHAIYPPEQNRRIGAEIPHVVGLTVHVQILARHHQSRSRNLVRPIARTCGILYNNKPTPDPRLSCAGRQEELNEAAVCDPQRRR